MSKRSVLDQLKEEKRGTLTLEDAKSAGVSKTYFYDYVSKNSLLRSSRGVYQTEDVWVDDFALLQKRCADSVFSHETALYLHGLTDREPFQLSITVKTGYNPHRLKKEGIIVYTIKEELLELGSMVLKSPYDNDVRVYDAERTVCDMIRSRNRLETEMVLDAVKQYARKRDKDIHKLMSYANALHVEKLVRNYFEVLL